MYEFEAIFFLALLFVIVYFVGSYRNRKLVVKYAKLVKELMKPHSRFVGFRAYGRSGFRSLCQMKRKKAFSKMQIAVALVDRENLMHYPLSLITRECDRIVCWGFLKGSVPLDMEIFPKSDRKTHKKIAKQKQLQEIIPEDEKLRESFRFVSSDVKLAQHFISEPKLHRSLFKSRNYLKRLSVSQGNSWIYLIGMLNEDSLKPLLDLIMSCGQVMTCNSLTHTHG